MKALSISTQNSIIVRVSLIGGGQTKGVNPFAARVSRNCITFFVGYNPFLEWFQVEVVSGLVYLIRRFCIETVYFRRNFSVSKICAVNFLEIMEDFYG